MVGISPLRYPGGKDKTYNYIKHLVNINDISTYIEPFAGRGCCSTSIIN